MSITKWKFDKAHSSIGFWVRHMLVSRIRGGFNRWTGELQFDEAVPAAASVVAYIDASSIDTHVQHRDDRLRAPDVLDVEHHPLITFRSTFVERIDERHFQLNGELTIRGVTHDVVLDVEYGGRMRDPSNRERVGFSARATISRKAFGVTFNQVVDAGGLALGDKLEIAIDLQAVEESATTTLAGPQGPFGV
jgi:polyisoprenoid-binding protein YceI